MSLPNPIGFGKRYYDDGILTQSKVYRRNSKGASSHSFQIIKVTDDEIELYFKLENFKSYNRYVGAMFMGLGVIIGLLTNIYWIPIITLIPASLFFILSFFSDKQTESWLSKEQSIIEKQINK